MNTPTQTTALDREIRQVEDELSRLRKELVDLDEKGLYRVSLNTGQVIEAKISGDELRFDNDQILRQMGLSAQLQQGASESPAKSASQIRKYLPFILIGGGVVLLLFAAMIGLGMMNRQPVISTAVVVVAGPTTLPTVIPTPEVTPTPTPSILPEDFIERAPIALNFPALKLKWDVIKGDWQINGNSVTLSEEGEQVRYYNSFVGSGNTVIGGNGTTPDDPLYTMRAADVNDVLLVRDRAGRTFYYRLIPFGGSRVERWITPGDTWVIEKADYPALTIIIRVGDERMVLRGKLYEMEESDS